MNLLNVTNHVEPSFKIKIWHRLQERIRNPKIRYLIAKIIAAFKKKPKEKINHLLANDIEKNGICKFSAFLTQEEVEDIKLQLETLKCIDPWDKTVGSFNCKHVPKTVHVAQIPDAPRLKVLHALAQDSRITNIVTAYFGCKANLDSIQAWWSMSGHSTPQEAENFHRDNDSIRFLKFFIYLTDVKEDSGPHVFVQKSHRKSVLLSRRRLTDNEVYNHCNSRDILKIIGNAGDAFLEDTYGIHKGELPLQGERLLVQFRYSITESIFRSPIITSKPEIADLNNINVLLYEQ